MIIDMHNHYIIGYETLGASQLLFGSDYPQDFLHGEDIKKYIDFMKREMKPEDYETVMSKNAIKLFGLESYG